MKDSKDADKLRDVVMKNSDIEWCRVEAKDGTKTTNILYAEHNKKEVDTPDAIEQLTSKLSILHFQLSK
ncbi:MAG: hypothetical protein Q3994_04920 [Prevotella sp.]|nr:hypothetical protein [Prevotella sp.]